MKLTFGAALLTASMLAAPAFAQITVIPMPPAPTPTATGPAVGPNTPVTPLTSADTKFVRAQLEGNLAEIQMAQLALQKSQDQNIRNFAQKMITDHTAANGTLTPIAQRHDIAMPTTLDPAHQEMLDRLSRLNGVAFDVAYINGMIRAHSEVIKQLDHQTINGRSTTINVWVANTRPVVMQHLQIAQEIKAELPRTG
jgi:putative membrane protein